MTRMPPTLFSVYLLLVRVTQTSFSVSLAATQLMLYYDHKMTRSSAKNITLGGSFPISAWSTSRMNIKRGWIKADPWCNPALIWKYSVSPALVDTKISQSLYMSCIIVTYRSETYLLRKHHHINSRGSLSYAFSKSTKTVQRLRWICHRNRSVFEESMNLCTSVLWYLNIITK